MFQTAPISAASQTDVTEQMAARLKTALTTHLQQVYAPDQRKNLRLFSATETADLLGVSGQFLRKCHSDGSLAEPAVNKGGRRSYSGDEIWAMRQALEAGSRSAGKYVPGRREGDKLQVIQLMNFKGGSAKLEFDGPTIYDALRYDDPLPLSDVIIDTYFPGIDLAPSRLILSEFETETAVNAGRGSAFFERLSNALAPIEDDYDVVIIDSPPALGFLTLTGLYAATSVLVPMTPSMLDLASTQQFIEMTSAYLGVIEDTGVSMDHDFFSFLITRDDPSDIPSQQIVSLMRALFQERIVPSTALRSTAIADASMLKMSIYEVARSDMTRSTYDRARTSMDAVGSDVANLIQKAWGRS